jgi:nephrocystin-3
MHPLYYAIILFIQRYGWQGEDDEVLQQNFNTALPRYPWLEQYRNKSVTELEFLHGHLNHPGKIPACILFRDKVSHMVHLIALVMMI